MSNTFTQYLRPSQWNNRRLSLTSIPETKEIIPRPRRHSSGGLVFVEQSHVLRSPCPSDQRFTYDSGIYNSEIPITVVRRNSPSVIECSVEDTTKTKRRKRLSISVILVSVILLVLAIIGILGLIASKTLPKPNSYCLGEHFCIPVKASKQMVTKLNLSALKERTEAETEMQDKLKEISDRRRNVLPRQIPRVVGMIDTSGEKEDKSKITEDRVIKTDGDVVPSKPHSPFMPREADKLREWHMRQREWYDQWDNRRLGAPPGVNPKVYWKNEL